MGKWIFKAWLKGSHVVPSVDTEARGFALFKFKHYNNVNNGTNNTSNNNSYSKLAYAVKVRNVANLRKIDLHLGKKGHNGPVVATLFGPTTPGISVEKGIVYGALRSSDLVGPLEGHSIFKLIKLILKRKIYVNVHTTDYPRGEIRGQVKKAYKHKKRHCHCNHEG